MEFFKKLKILPRWFIAAMDAVVLINAALFAYYIHFDYNTDFLFEFLYFKGALIFMLTGLFIMLNTRSYDGIVRHTGFRDVFRLLKTITINFVFLLFLNSVILEFLQKPVSMTFPVLLLASVISFFALVLYRLFVKELFTYFKNNLDIKSTKICVIFGAGEAGVIAQEVINRDSNTHFISLAFLDDDPKKEGKYINGKKIYKGLDHLQTLVENHGVTELIIAIRHLTVQRKREIIDTCLILNIHVRILSPINQWINGIGSEGVIREVNIEDLLSRERIELDNNKIDGELRDKIVLVSGAGGSIGGELCRQIIHYEPKILILLDQAESALYDVEQDIKDVLSTTKIIVVLSDIRNKHRMNELFRNYKPQIVFHAAAYKHVPMMEFHPEESIWCNILGTKILADIAVLNMVEKFVLVSTDKAVNPTSVMGATKRAAEMYVQSLNEFLAKNHKINHTKFITTRFGNVLASNGSVIPLFTRQIKKGGPVTVTHPDITRYFMTISEACQLVLEAGVMGNGGEIYVFDMGQPVKILDLAKKMIQLSGKKVGEDIKIIFTGLRQGEKLYEELLNDSEIIKITHHPKIKIAKVSTKPFYKIEGQIEMFYDMLDKSPENDLVAHLKTIVPVFKSNASRFEVLDRVN